MMHYMMQIMCGSVQSRHLHWRIFWERSMAMRKLQSSYPKWPDISPVGKMSAKISSMIIAKLYKMEKLLTREWNNYLKSCPFNCSITSGAILKNKRQVAVLQKLNAYTYFLIRIMKQIIFVKKWKIASRNFLIAHLHQYVLNPFCGSNIKLL